jgi:hypothetical protein
MPKEFDGHHHLLCMTGTHLPAERLDPAAAVPGAPLDLIGLAARLFEKLAH